MPTGSESPLHGSQEHLWQVARWSLVAQLCLSRCAVGRGASFSQPGAGAERKNESGAEGALSSASACACFRTHVLAVTCLAPGQMETGPVQ